MAYRSLVFSAALMGPVGCAVPAPSCPTACTGEDVCVAGACESVYDATWTFTAGTVTAAAHEPDGTDWDIDLSAPDPYLTLWIDDAQQVQTPHASDTYVGTWSMSGPPTMLTRASTLRVVAMDADTFGGGDEIVECDLSGPLDPGLLRSGQLECDGAGGSLVITMTPE